MKLALITDQKGLHIIDRFDLSYHLVLAQHILEEPRYADYYRVKHDNGDFIMMDNGAPEDELVSLEGLKRAAEMIRPDEIILPDVLADSDRTIEATTNLEVLAFVPPRQRAVTPQGNTLDEWLSCANYFVETLDFATLCIPKHTERFPNGRVGILRTIKKLGWDQDYNVHLLGVWGDPYVEVRSLVEAAPWVRGIDTAAPFALAQHKIVMTVDTPHYSHVWGRDFNSQIAKENIETMLSIVGMRV